MQKKKNEKKKNLRAFLSKVLKILTFSISKTNFIALNTSLYNTPNIKTSNLFFFTTSLKYYLFIIFYSHHPSHHKATQLTASTTSTTHSTNHDTTNHRPPPIAPPTAQPYFSLSSSLYLNPWHTNQETHHYYLATQPPQTQPTASTHQHNQPQPTTQTHDLNQP